MFVFAVLIQILVFRTSRSRAQEHEVQQITPSRLPLTPEVTKRNSTVYWNIESDNESDQNKVRERLGQRLGRETTGNTGNDTVMKMAKPVTESANLVS